MEKVYNQFRNTMQLASIITWVTYCLIIISCVCSVYGHTLTSVKIGFVVYILFITKDILLKRLAALSEIVVNNIEEK